MPVEIEVYDAGYKYNYAPIVSGRAERDLALEVFEKLHFGDTVIVHLINKLHKEEYLKKLGLIRGGVRLSG